MSKTLLPCDIVQDLLPSYVDGLLSETGTEAVSVHLEDCTSCRTIYEDMTTPEETTPEEKEQAKEEIDYLRKIKTRTRRIVTLVSSLAVILTACFVTIYFLLFSGEYILNTVKYDIEVSSHELKIQGKLPLDFTTAKQKINEENGVVSLQLSSKKTFLFTPHKNWDLSYTATSEIHEVRINGDIIWQEGTTISPYIARVYDARHDYIGSPSDNEYLSNTLGIQDTLGDFTSELQTKNEPYGWTLCLSSPQTGDEAKLQARMKRYSYVFLALIGNAGEITWKYTINGDSHTYSVTAEDAQEEFGKDVKSFATTIRDFQNFAREIGFES